MPIEVGFPGTRFGGPSFVPGGLQIQITALQAAMTAVQAKASTTPQIFAPLTGGTVTIVETAQAVIPVIINPAGTLVSATIEFPTTSFNGQMISLSFTQNIATLTLDGQGKTINGAPSDGSPFEGYFFVFSTVLDQWTRSS